jgi:hypothetical protein
MHFACSFVGGDFSGTKAYFFSAFDELHGRVLNLRDSLITKAAPRRKGSTLRSGMAQG